MALKKGFAKKCFGYCWAGVALLCLASLAAAQLPLKDPTLDTVVARVEGKNITRAELMRMFESAPPDLQQMFRTNVESAIMQYHIIQFLGQEGERRKLDEKSPLKEQLETMRFNILAGAVVNNERDGFPVSNDVIEAYYQDHQADYKQAAIKGIFISFKPQASKGGTGAQDLEAAAKAALGAAGSNRTEAEARALAADVVQRLRGGENFIRVMEEVSEDLPSKRAGGDMGMVNAGSKYPPDFRGAVLALESGAVSDPIRQSTGFYVVRVEETSQQPLRDVRADIIQTIRQEHLNQWFLDLNKRFRPQITDPNIMQGLK